MSVRMFVVGLVTMAMLILVVRVSHAKKVRKITEREKGSRREDDYEEI